MGDKPYIRDPSGRNNGKWGINDQDQDDFEQEVLIQQWLESQGHGGFDFKHISRKGTARNTLIAASFSLDQEIKIDGAGSGTYADLIVGRDGRDLFDGDNNDEEQDPYAELCGYVGAILGLVRGAEAREWAEATYEEWIRCTLRQSET